MPSVFITGASTGIGHDAVLRMADRGWVTFAGVRTDEDGQRVIEDSRGGAQPVKCDITRPEEIEEARASILAATGGSLTGLVNNAGIALAGPIEFVPIGDLRRQLETNVIGHAAVTKAFIPALRGEAGRIVNISSASGMFSPPLLGPYSMSKYALEAMSDALRRELATSRISVAVVQPARIQTPIWDKSLESFRVVLDSMGDQGRGWYGRMIDGLVAAAHKPGGDPVSMVSDAIEHALTSRKPKIRYPVGNEARLVSVATKLVPDRLLDRFDPFA